MSNGMVIVTRKPKTVFFEFDQETGELLIQHQFLHACGATQTGDDLYYDMLFTFTTRLNKCLLTLNKSNVPEDSTKTEAIQAYKKTAAALKQSIVELRNNIPTLLPPNFNEAKTMPHIRVLGRAIKMFQFPQNQDNIRLLVEEAGKYKDTDEKKNSRAIDAFFARLGMFALAAVAVAGIVFAAPTGGVSLILLLMGALLMGPLLAAMNAGIYAKKLDRMVEKSVAIGAAKLATTNARNELQQLKTEEEEPPVRIAPDTFS